jgi:hypothetical protein
MLSDWPGARYACASDLGASSRAELSQARLVLRRYRREVVRRQLAEAPALLAEARRALRRYRAELGQIVDDGRIDETASRQRSSSICIEVMR